MLSPFWQKFAIVALAIGCALLSCTTIFHDVGPWLTNMASLLVGGSLLGRPGDTSIDNVKSVASCMSGPPPDNP